MVDGAAVSSSFWATRICSQVHRRENRPGSSRPPLRRRSPASGPPFGSETKTVAGDRAAASRSGPTRGSQGQLSMTSDPAPTFGDPGLGSDPACCGPILRSLSSAQYSCK